MRTVKWSWPLLAMPVVICVTLCGCGGSTRSDTDSFEANAGPYSGMFRQVLDDPDISGYVKTILSDGKVDSFEFRDAQEHVITCLNQADIEASYIKDQFGQVGLSASADASDPQTGQAIAQCQTEWMGPIQDLYWKVFSNPANANLNDLIAACLVRKGLAPAGFTGQDYVDLLGDPVSVDTEGVTITEMKEPTEDILLPNGVSLSDPEVTACQLLPLQ